MALISEEVLQTVWMDNTVHNYLVALGIFICSFLAFRFFNIYLLNKLKSLSKRTETDWDDLLIDFIGEIKWFFYFMLSLFISSHYLALPPLVGTAIYYAMLVLLGFYAAKGVSRVLERLLQKHMERNKENGGGASSSMIELLSTLIRVAIWVIAIMMILSNMGIEVTPLLASMGIGGIAIALALQSVLGDVFAAFVIYFDKPFKEGDFIVVGSDKGFVKHIGIKSTRIQALEGQELIISNTELVNSRVNNYKQMEKRRVVFGFGVKYDTGMSKLKRIKEIVAKTFESVGNADLERVHFREFGDFSLKYEVVYYIKSPDYNRYMDIQEKINMRIYSAFEKEGIEFAFPTQTVEILK